MIGISYKALRAADKNAIREAQGECQLCGKTDGLVVDHCHNTDIVRGVLCGSCNVKIGWVETLEYGWLQKANDYLGGHSTALEITKIMRRRFDLMNQKWISELNDLERRRIELTRELEKANRRAKEVERHLTIQPALKLAQDAFEEGR